MVSDGERFSAALALTVPAAALVQVVDSSTPSPWGGRSEGAARGATVSAETTAPLGVGVSMAP
eukprot:scaffold216813_cov31-Tisochrysis_lutea.AAC.5